MISEDRFGLRPIWDANMAVYKVVAEICKRHNLRHYVSDGTLLGAIRHGGFIPWDDDFDISMPRPDYEKLKRLAKDELPDNLVWIDRDNVPDYPACFGKVQENRVSYINGIEAQTGRKLSNGIYIDIFPIDGYPDGAIRFWRMYCCDLFLRSACCHCESSFASQKGNARARWILGFVLCLIVPGLRKKKTRQDWQEYEVRRNDFSACDLTGRSCGATSVLRRPPIPKKAWGDPCEMQFDNVSVFVPEDFDSCLRSEYGDWMKLPPAERQKPVHSEGAYKSWWAGVPRNEK